MIEMSGDPNNLIPTTYIPTTSTGNVGYMVMSYPGRPPMVPGIPMPPGMGMSYMPLGGPPPMIPAVMPMVPNPHGINAHTEDLLRDSSQVNLVKQAGLVLFCWGDDNNEPDTIRHLKELGLHAIIYDKIDKFISKEVKESIFRLEARESERVMIRAVAEKAEREKAEHEHPTEGGIPQVQEPHYLDMDGARKAASAGSTSSCLSMWTQPGDAPGPPQTAS